MHQREGHNRRCNYRAHQENMTVKSNSCNSLPAGPCLPNSNSNRNPITLGGRTNGEVNMPSINPLAWVSLGFGDKFYLYIRQIEAFSLFCCTKLYTSIQFTP